MTSTISTGRRKQLGGQLKQRRALLSPQWAKPGAFAEDTGLGPRTVYDAEDSLRVNFRTSTCAAIDAAYRLRPGSFRRALEGGDIEAAPGSPPLQPASSAADASPREHGGDVLDEAIRRLGDPARRELREIAGAVADAASRRGVNLDVPGARLEGGWVFGAGTDAAFRWDILTREGVTLAQAQKMLAIIRVTDRAQAGSRTAAGLARIV